MYIGLWLAAAAGKKWLKEDDDRGRAKLAGKRKLDGSDGGEAFDLARNVAPIKRHYSCIVLFEAFGPNQTDPASQKTALSKLDPAMTQTKV